MPNGEADSEVSSVIRLGGRFLGVSLGAQDLWWQSRYWSDVEGLMRWASEDGLEGAPDLLARLRKAGLLQPLPPITATSDFLSTHRILPEGSARAGMKPSPTSS